MGRVGWSDNTHEGKLLRRMIDRLYKEFKNLDDSDLDTMIKLIHAVSQASHTKIAIAKHVDLDKKVDMVLKYYEEEHGKKMMPSNYARELKE